MANFAPKRATYGSGDRRWLRDPIKSERHGITVEYGDVSGSIQDGVVPSGTYITGEGLLLDDLAIATGEAHLVAVVHAGTVDRRYLPAPLNQAAEAALGQITFINGTPPQS